MRKTDWRVSLWAMAALVLLYAPLIAIAVLSVNASRYGMVWKGITFEWYAKLVRNEQILDAARNTLILALSSTLFATVLGTALALGLDRFPWPKPVFTALDSVLHLPIVAPDIVIAAALVLAFGILRGLSAFFDPGLPVMIIGHITFQIAFVALVVRARLGSISTTVFEAARDLYAAGPFMFRHITLPLLLPAIIAGGLLAFTLSLDDFVISFFTAGPASTTLPIFIYASVRRGVTPEIHALSTLIVGVTICLVVAAERGMQLKSKESET